MVKKSFYGLIGKKLGHSFSPAFFNEKFSREKIDAEYGLYELQDISELPLLLRSNPDIKGLNVTVPYKKEVMRLMDDIDCKALKAGAINVVKVIRNERGLRLKGYNTDLPAFRESLENWLPDSMLKNGGCKALILGSGGGAAAIAGSLADLGIEFMTVSRNPSEGQIGYGDITPELLESHRLIVNTTPLGMFPHTETFPDIPYSLLNERHYCYDLVYNPPMTAFLSKADEYGAHIKNGEQMLRLQAEKSWRIWQENES